MIFQFKKNGVFNKKIDFFSKELIFQKKWIFQKKNIFKVFFPSSNFFEQIETNYKIKRKPIECCRIGKHKNNGFLCNLLTYLFGRVKCDKPTSKSQSRFDWFDLFCVLISIEPYDLLWFLLKHKKIYNLSVYNYIFKYRNSFTWMLIGVLNTGC